VNCPDLRQLYGANYRITLDEAAESPSDPWMYQLPCVYGIIYPHGPGTLALEIDYHVQVARKVLAIPGTRLWQDGGGLPRKDADGNDVLVPGDKTIVFPVSAFPEVAALVKPRRRRHCTSSPEHLAALREAGVAHRFARHGPTDGCRGV
jgi:hypothetical protein